MKNMDPLNNPDFDACIQACQYTPEEECNIYHFVDQKDILPPIHQTDAFEHPKIQFLPFPDPLINYLLTDPTLKAYQKLIKACKYFYSKKRITVIPSVRVQYFKSPSSGVRETPILNLYSNQVLKIWITTLFDSGSDVNQKSLSNFISSKIYKCQARVITIYHQEITEAEFRFLVQPEFVFSLDMEQTLIIKADGTFMGIVDVLKRVPNALQLEFTDPSITSYTFLELSELPGKNKLIHFLYGPSLRNMSQFQPNFNSEMFQIFIKKNAASNAEFEICFGYATKEFLEAEKEKMSRFIETWKSQQMKPKITMWKKIQNTF